ncbi:hypothetical protein [Shewanella algae]|uniref:hypothetical protein n=1 Tax=Shewanella algae TaxID=38313 RepID=UPI0011823E65|nr:hypothetical protein [Shewanella algae]MBO2646362.1 hypothetical protein [Shewanella algae]
MDLTSSLKTIRNEIDWYESTDLKALTNSHRELQSELESQSRECTQSRGKVQQIQENINNQSRSINSLWNPINWFDSQQRDLRDRVAAMKKSLATAKKYASKAQARLQELEGQIRAKGEEIERFRGFDFDAKSEKRTVLANQLSQQKRKTERIAIRKQQVDDVLDPIVKQIRDAEQKKTEAIAVKRQAQRLDEELSNADNSYERAMVHEECENKFATGSPRKVISRKDSEIRRLDRDLEKLMKRAKTVADKASRDIQKLVLDGNNLCYQGDTFIGLVALKTLVPILAGDFEIIVVFDASIRRALGSGDSDVRDVLGNDIEVHVVATSVKADETVLDLAGTDKTTFVVSNDRFAEFGEKPAIRDQRVIRHEIVSGQVLIHDLGVSETFKQ